MLENMLKRVMHTTQCNGNIEAASQQVILRRPRWQTLSIIVSLCKEQARLRVDFWKGTASRISIVDNGRGMTDAGWKRNAFR